MGVVYRARQLKANRMVALKVVIADDHAGGDQLKRFRTETESIARLQHPGIVQIFEVGEYQGKPFFSLEYCPLGSLDAYLSGKPLPDNLAARMVLNLAHSIQAAHNAKVVHRDLKPANVLIVNRESRTADRDSEKSAQVLESKAFKITDFGLAKKLDDVSQTKTDVILGTPSYMAPEQARRGRDVGVAVDVYSLGAILYESITGRPPFIASSSLETVMQVVRDEPVPPRRLQPGLSRDLETICLKCLAKGSQATIPNGTGVGRRS